MRACQARRDQVQSVCWHAARKSEAAVTTGARRTNPHSLVVWQMFICIDRVAGKYTAERAFGMIMKRMTIECYGGTPPFVNSDEHDVQGMLHALLLAMFDDVRQKRRRQSVI